MGEDRRQRRSDEMIRDAYGEARGQDRGSKAPEPPTRRTSRPGSPERRTVAPIDDRPPVVVPSPQPSTERRSNQSRVDSIISSLMVGGVISLLLFAFGIRGGGDDPRPPNDVGAAVAVLASECGEGDYGSCDVLSLLTEPRSDEHQFARSCGDRLTAQAVSCSTELGSGATFAIWRSECRNGDYVACDLMFFHGWSTEERFPETCGGIAEMRQGECVARFGLGDDK